MSKFLFFFFFFFTFIPATAQDFNVHSFLSDVADSFNNQDCLKYSSYFIKSLQTKKRKEYGLFFAANDSKMSLKECHVVSESDSNIEVFVSYLIDSNEFISRILIENENGDWKINKEYMIKKSSPNASYQYTSNPFKNNNQNCSTGSCSKPQIPFGSLNACRDYGFEPIPCRGGNCNIK